MNAKLRTPVLLVFIVSVCLLSIKSTYSQSDQETGKILPEAENPVIASFEGMELHDKRIYPIYHINDSCTWIEKPDSARQVLIRVDHLKYAGFNTYINGIDINDKTMLDEIKYIKLEADYLDKTAIIELDNCPEDDSLLNEENIGDCWTRTVQVFTIQPQATYKDILIKYETVGRNNSKRYATLTLRWVGDVLPMPPGPTIASFEGMEVDGIDDTKYNILEEGEWWGKPEEARQVRIKVDHLKYAVFNTFINGVNMNFRPFADDQKSIHLRTEKKDEGPNKLYSKCPEDDSVPIDYYIQTCWKRTIHVFTFYPHVIKDEDIAITYEIVYYGNVKKAVTLTLRWAE